MNLSFEVKAMDIVEQIALNQVQVKLLSKIRMQFEQKIYT